MKIVVSVSTNNGTSETEVKVSHNTSSNLNVREEDFIDFCRRVWKKAQDTFQEEMKLDRHLVLISVPTSMKIHTIKTIRAYTGIGLKEAKDFIESGPCDGRPKKIENIDRSKIDNCIQDLRQIGCKADFYNENELQTLEVIGS